MNLLEVEYVRGVKFTLLFPRLNGSQLGNNDFKDRVSNEVYCTSRTKVLSSVWDRRGTKEEEKHYFTIFNP